MSSAFCASRGCISCPCNWGLAAFVVNWLGRRHVLDMRLDQMYVRRQRENAVDGAPLGVGICY
jgi:hypothetical protein